MNSISDLRIGAGHLRLHLLPDVMTNLTGVAA